VTDYLLPVDRYMYTHTHTQLVVQILPIKKTSISQCNKINKYFFGHYTNLANSM